MAIVEQMCLLIQCKLNGIVNLVEHICRSQGVKLEAMPMLNESQGTELEHFPKEIIQDCAGWVWSCVVRLAQLLGQGAPWVLWLAGGGRFRIGRLSTNCEGAHNLGSSRPSVSQTSNYAEFVLNNNNHHQFRTATEECRIGNSNTRADHTHKNPKDRILIVGAIPLFSGDVKILKAELGDKVAGDSPDTFDGANRGAQEPLE